MTPDLLITNATVVTADEVGAIYPDGAVAVTNGAISYVGPADAFQGAARKEIDGGGMLLTPGLINTHCHAPDSLFRGLIEDLHLEPWLQKVWQAETAILTPATVRLGATLGLAELLLGGVTTVMDMFWHPLEVTRAALTLGMRISNGPMFFDGVGMDKLDPEGRLRVADEFFEKFGKHDLVLPACMPHGTYTVGPTDLRRAKDIAEANGALFCTHASETRAERDIIQDRYGRSVIAHLDDLDLLDARTVLAHCVWLDDADIDILARSGASVSHNPLSNLKLASGIAPVPELLAADIPVTLGTDGAISGNDLDMWLAMRLGATLHRGATLRPDAVTTSQVVKMVTRDAAASLGAGDRIGSLEIGKAADMILIDTERAHAAPMFDPLTHLVFSCAKSDVRHVFVAGQQVVSDGALTGVDLDEVLARIRALTPDIAASVAT